jgi:hypothetical protein
MAKHHFFGCEANQRLVVKSYCYYCEVFDQSRTDFSDQASKKARNSLLRTASQPAGALSSGTYLILGPDVLAKSWFQTSRRRVAREIRGRIEGLYSERLVPRDTNS